jgi:hypothetical protein
MLRALGGPSTLVVVGSRLTIGRAPDADLQLLDPHVSRRHARIERDENGDVVLVDLASTSGTRIGDLRIERHVLQDGDLIRIAGVTLRYEDVGEAPRQQRAPIERGIRALRPTLRMDAIALPPSREATRDVVPERIIAPIEPIQAAMLAAPSAGMAATAGLVVPPLSSAVLRARPRTQVRPARRWTPSAVDPSAQHMGHTVEYVASTPHASDDAFYEDDPEPAPDPSECRGIIRDVFEYRTLRMRAVRGESLPSPSVERLRDLDQRMHRHSVTQRALDHLRRYHRFRCDVPGWLGSLSGKAVSTLAVELEDIGAGGAQVSCPERRFQCGDTCWLVVDLDNENESEGPLVVFRARVAWSSPSAARMGLAFCGAAKSGLDALELIRTDR